jgi:acetyl esterase/lipase
MLPVRGDSPAPWTFQPPGIPFTLDVFTPAFGEDAKIRAQASPITHVRRDLPPFRIFVAEHDLPTLAKEADDFDAALRKSGCDVKLFRMGKRNHNSLMFSAIAKDDPAARAVLDFVGK